MPSPATWVPLTGSYPPMRQSKSSCVSGLVAGNSYFSSLITCGRETPSGRGDRPTTRLSESSSLLTGISGSTMLPIVFRSLSREAAITGSFFSSSAICHERRETSKGLGLRVRITVVVGEDACLVIEVRGCAVFRRLRLRCQLVVRSHLGLHLIRLSYLGIAGLLWGGGEEVMSVYVGKLGRRSSRPSFLFLFLTLAFFLGAITSLCSLFKAVFMVVISFVCFLHSSSSAITLSITSGSLKLGTLEEGQEGMDEEGGVKRY